eukprot:1730888-Pleurochrysis_carterae.AAC.3
MEQVEIGNRASDSSLSSSARPARPASSGSSSRQRARSSTATSRSTASACGATGALPTHRRANYHDQRESEPVCVMSLFGTVEFSCARAPCYGKPHPHIVSTPAYHHAQTIGETYARGGTTVGKSSSDGVCMRTGAAAAAAGGEANELARTHERQRAQSPMHACASAAQVSPCAPNLP